MMNDKSGFAYFISAMEKYTLFKERSRRKEFWYFILFSNIFACAYNIISIILNFNYFLSLVADIIFFIPNMAVSVRRLHDVNRSGWWIFYAIMYIAPSDSEDNRFGPDHHASLQDKSIFECIIGSLKKYFQFSGRTSRKEYWSLTFFSVAAVVVVGAIGRIVGGSYNPLLFIVLVLLLPNIAARVRRLHDIDQSGWWIFFPSLYVLPSDEGENHFGPNPISLEHITTKTATPASSSLSMEALDKIEKLAALKEKDILTEDEFQEHKKNLLEE